MPLHHFLPEFYLRQWIDPASAAPNRTPHVWKISRDGRNRRYHHPAERVFGIENGNTLESITGERNETVENILSRVESVLARALRSELPNRQPLGRDQVDAINMFFASMLVRVPAARASLQPGIAAMARIERETAEATNRTIPDTRLFEQNALAHITHSSLFDILPELERMTHWILRAPSGESFLTSDRPAVISALTGAPGLANPNALICLPLSPNILLHLTHDEAQFSGYYNLEARDVLQWNQLIVSQCSQWFISNRSDVDSCWFTAAS